MPQYQYKDENGHMTTVTHRMMYSTGIVCTTCDAEMWRVPQSVMVTWGGLPPSGGDLAPDVQNIVNNADRNRAKFEETHENHERATSDD